MDIDAPLTVAQVIQETGPPQGTDWTNASEAASAAIFYACAQHESLGYFRQGMQMMATAATESAPSDDSFLEDVSLPAGQAALMQMQRRNGQEPSPVPQRALPEPAQQPNGHYNAVENPGVTLPGVSSLVAAARSFLGGVSPAQWRRLGAVLTPEQADLLEAGGDAETAEAAATSIIRLQEKLLADPQRFSAIREVLTPLQMTQLVQLSLTAQQSVAEYPDADPDPDPGD